MFKTGEIVYVFGDMDDDGFYQVSGGLYISCSSYTLYYFSIICLLYNLVFNVLRLL